MIERTASNRMAARDQRGFYGDLEDAGVQPDVETKVRRSELNGPIADRLGVPQGTETVVRSRRMSGDGQLLQTAVTYLHPAVVDQVPQLAELNTGAGGMYARMEEAGHKLRQQDRVSARVADAEWQELFGISSDVAVVVIERITRGTDDQVLEITEIAAPADRQVFVYDL
ncbi:MULTISPECIES: UTRA domain-containing protein [Nocardiopsis]|uniref:UTRA domain-containing protein n=1 Tax=Nocardiopsis changdeensis TaxID=2831969 RepID=A0ABX8BWK1_9ACTN|nr:MULTISPECIES: UTRA domain-containing protein [Nocardiopsis]QUX26367.1 UTRA domain-containing protein [Nocardiopsis changdeensis]QYX40813.1 UTRA domain-containing protein [Nocardiopsis sp. MT53]